MLLCFLALPSLVGGVDVVMATDRFTLPGLVVAVNSVLNATSNPLTITVVSPKDARRRVASVLNCVFRGLEEDKLKVIGFDVPLLLLNDSSRLEAR